MLKTLSILGLAGLMSAGLRADAPRDPGPGVAPDAAWHMLVLGNDRFAGGLTVGPHLDAALRRRLVERQRPWAVVVADADSRVTPEFIFDMGFGDLYVVRSAASVVEPGPSIDSVCYALEHLGPRLVVVLGHSRDGVVHAALKGAKDGAEGRLSEDIAPAIEQARDRVAGLSGSALDASAVERNVLLEMERLLKAPAVADRVRAGKVKVVGGIYNLDTGSVVWLGMHPNQGDILAGKRP